MTFTLKRPAAMFATVAMAFTFAACGDDDTDSSGSGSAPAGETSTIEVPEKYQGKTLKVASDASYAPNEFIEEGSKEIVGMDVDLIEAVGEKLGLEVDVQNSMFDAIIPGIASGKFDLGISSFTATKERQETVDMVTYFTAGTSFFTTTDGPEVTAVDELCDKRVAVQKGTIQADEAQAQAKKCKVQVLVYPDQNGANLALSSGRADLSMADSPVAAYQVKQSEGKFKLTGKPYDSAPYGIALPKDSGLEEPVREALAQLIDEGKYLEILEKWGVQDGAIDEPVINGATS